MSGPAREALVAALSDLLAEVLDGARPGEAWLLNGGDAGMLRSLDRLSAAAASAPGPAGGASIVAHVDHVRYGLELLNRWSRGEDAFGDADYTASWRRGSVTEAEWRALRSALRREAGEWQGAVRGLGELGRVELTGVLASVAHLAYHLGAIRQIDRSTRGPLADEGTAPTVTG